MTHYRAAIAALWLLCAVAAPLCEPPLMHGKATYYAAPYLGRVMRNGDVYDGQHMTCAVDRWLWPMLAGKRLRVCVNDNSGWPYCTFRCISVIATDTGRLYEHGVVVDLSVAAMMALVGNLRQGVVDVEVWR